MLHNWILRFEPSRVWGLGTYPYNKKKTKKNCNPWAPDPETFQKQRLTYGISTFLLAYWWECPQKLRRGMQGNGGMVITRLRAQGFSKLLALLKVFSYGKVYKGHLHAASNTPPVQRKPCCFFRGSSCLASCRQNSVDPFRSLRSQDCVMFPSFYYAARLTRPM